MSRILALILLIISSPAFGILFVVIKLTSKGPFIFKQKRMGKDKRVFTMYKIRTMIERAEDLRSKIKDLNEADGPVFKIYNDPRYTKVGKLLAHTAIDELPQLINIIKGEMSFVGPRPLPVQEAKKLPKKYDARFSVLPGMTSPWVVGGTDHSSFDRWMKLDLEYVKKKSFWYDSVLFLKTIKLILRLFIKNLNGL